MSYIQNPKTGRKILVDGATYKKLEKEGYNLKKVKSPRRSPKTRYSRSPRMSKRSHKSLYERLGGIYAIAAVINDFSDNIIKNPVVGRNSANPCLRKWHRESLERLPGLKWMRTLWVASITGGPYKYVPTKRGKNQMDLSNAHRELGITSEEFDEVAGELSRSLDKFKVPAREKKEVLGAFAAHKKEVVGSEKKRSYSHC